LGGLWLLRRPRDRAFGVGVLWLAFALGAAFVAGAQSVQAASARFVLPGLGLGAAAAAVALLSGRSPRALWTGRAVLAAIAVSLFVRAAALAANFAADAPGRANAFAAADWIEANVPAGAKIGVRATTAMVDRFPPVVFSRYKIVPVEADANPARLPQWYATNARWLDAIEPPVRARYWTREIFGGGTLVERLAADPFTSANFPIAVLELGPEDR
jgi:hypothetical protein